MRRAILLLTALLVPATACAPADDAASASDAEAGASVAAAPVVALPSAIVGEGGELEGSDVHYLDGDEATTGYLAVPEGDGPFPALVIVHEWNGLTDRVRQLADDFADEGYVTLAADLFRGQVGANAGENRALMAEAEPNVIPNLDAAVAFLKARSDVTGRVGAMGWCYGGGVALSFGLDGANHEATAIFYGSLVEDPDRLAHISHEVYGTFGELDGGIPPEAVERFASALEAAGVENDVHVYDDVGHGFWLRVDEDPAVRTEPARDAWSRLKAYLDRTLRPDAM